MSYTLRFPIRLAPGREVSDVEEGPHTLDGRPFRFSRNAPYLVILVDGFADESSALDYLPHLRAALYWPAIDHGLAYTAELRRGRVIYSDDPIQPSRNIGKTFKLKRDRVDGIVDGNVPCAYPAEMQLVSMTASEVEIVLGTQFPRFKQSLSVGLAETDPTVLDNERLCTALTLYCARFHERSPNARLLALVMALEVLTEKLAKAPIVRQLLERWRAELRQMRDGAHPEADAEALEALDRELFFRKEASIRSRIRALVSDSLSQPDSTSDVQRAVAIYDLRGQLVHDGRVPPGELSDAIKDAERIVGEVLKNRLRKGATP